MNLCSANGLHALMGLKGVGAKRAEKLAEHYGSWDELASAGPEELARVVGAGVAKNLTPEAFRAGPVLYQAPDGMSLLSRYDQGWPAGLLGIPDPPALLWSVGTLPSGPLLTVVGTREPTVYGSGATKMIARAAAGQGIGIVSGLARGVDSLAHEACLDAGQPTWAVVGQGLATLVEGARADLSRRIVAEGGGLLAEVAPGTPSEPYQLIRRNRLLSALPGAVVIAESSVPGEGPDRVPAGTMHTARYATAQGRPLVVVCPQGEWAAQDKATGNLALIDPGGCPADAVHATHKDDIARCESRRPYADLVLRGKDDLPGLWELFRSRPAAALTGWVDPFS